MAGPFARPVRTLPLLLAAGLVLLGGCARDMSDLETWINEINQRPAPRIAPLPQVKPYETFIYEAHQLRAPFTPDHPVRQVVAEGDGEGIRPDASRNREYLEEFPLDTLRMVGTLELRDDNWALVRSRDGAVHRVRRGNYLGQNHGRITAILETRIELMEIIPDGMGGWMERRAAIQLTE